jgi:hypothetical protein
MSARAKALVETAKWRLKGAPLAAGAAWRDGAGPRAADAPAQHLDATLGWIERAHAATGGKGVARSYVLRRHHRYGITGWLPAYPETTGYIIPTFYDAARQIGRPALAEQATAMAEWEASIQLADGAVRGGTVSDPVSPAVFNTGQVLFGWVAAFEETGDERFREAARRAASWLVDHLDDDGCWRRGASQFAAAGGHVYNARAAWGLARCAALTGDAASRDAAARAADFACRQQLGNGWFADNCLSDPERPLTHTIAYAAQGVLEIGLLQGEERFVAAARRTAEGALRALRADGFLPGRLDAQWRAAVDWSCVTGQAQMALVWDRLARLDGRGDFAAAAERSLGFALTVQDLANPDPGIRGGVPGSFPIWGGYGNYEYLNWAAKFLADALLGRAANTPGGTRG